MWWFSFRSTWPVGLRSTQQQISTQAYHDHRITLFIHASFALGWKLIFRAWNYSQCSSRLVVQEPGERDWETDSQFHAWIFTSIYFRCQGEFSLFPPFSLSTFKSHKHHQDLNQQVKGKTVGFKMSLQKCKSVRQASVPILCHFAKGGTCRTSVCMLQVCIRHVWIGKVKQLFYLESGSYESSVQ